MSDYEEVIGNRVKKVVQAVVLDSGEHIAEQMDVLAIVTTDKGDLVKVSLLLPEPLVNQGFLFDDGLPQGTVTPKFGVGNPDIREFWNVTRPLTNRELIDTFTR